MVTVVTVAALAVVVAWPSRPGARSVAPPEPKGAVRRRPVARRRLVALASVMVALLVGPVLAFVAAGVAVAWPRWQAHRARQQRRWAVVGAVPEAADLLAMAVQGGLTVPLALEVAAGWSPEPVGPVLRRATDEVAAGRSVAEALEAVADDLGPPARPLVDVLLAAERYGVPLADGLDRAAREARLERRRRGEERARRVPVLLLFPLVLCVLPAFGLLTVAPLLVGSLPELPPIQP